MKKILIKQFEKDSLRVVVDYLEYSEKKHYEESEECEDHIYKHVERLKCLLDRIHYEEMQPEKTQDDEKDTDKNTS